MDDCVYTRTVAGERQAQLTAKTGLYYRDRQDVVLTQVEAQFHDQDRDIVVRSERGGFNLGSRAGELIGGVVGRTSDGITLRTTRLGFDAQNKRLHTDDAVLLEGPYFTLRGVGADADLTLAKAELRSAVEATAWGGKAP
jgi:LPS export ABC transporter protein LptC